MSGPAPAPVRDSLVVLSAAAIAAGSALGAVPAPGPVEPTARPQARQSAVGAPTAQGLGDVDFRNFTYPLGNERVRVTDGEFFRDDPNDRLFFQVLDVDLGDLDGDGSPEAVVTTLANTGGSGQFTDGLVYALVAGEPKVVATLGVGDRASGGIHEVAIANGAIVEERFGDGSAGACCPTFVRRTRLLLRSGKLVVSGRASKRAYAFAGSVGTRRRPGTLRFLPGTRTATVEGDGLAGDRIRVEARAGRRLTITLEPAPRGTVPARIVVRYGSRRVLRVIAGERASVRLPSSGAYILEFGATRAADGATASVVGTALVGLR